ncbi:tRNA (adenosine(37)-N6)-threonylcarbamoyltransferase complex dimerization subunit type 1 TsaB [Actinokineospora diospyrosa]|uniref:tRNA threonylcarbamoyl adenosine modification protein YeaZ n=1 Tax=Actinokineospora diospyrosa TaxID=103728 RepID=A0ABT1IIN3_9PSEU|nr:tRNA (adenosine(37)-N6)-threonylcarbamoyltransferase complex dimerization subunit type 1 TsaB [Actinokineospora diospyrosa]MCP2272498.1 tRNA threonylcarbamoyl adenosine modification protein YeaZ [Actinokineospora diospyrosa]
MLVLAVDTATPAVTAGVVELTGGTPRLLAQRVTVDARAHGELLTPHLRDAVAEAGHTLADLDALVCGVGPGPFTGLRAGMVTAAALGHALDRPVFPVCTLDAIAAEVPGEPLLVVTDARRKELYWARYAADGTRLDEPAVNRPADIPLAGVTRIVGARIHDLGQPVTGPEYPSPLGLVLAADLTGEPGPLTPLYLRRPDAVEPGARKRVSPG